MICFFNSYGASEANFEAFVLVGVVVSSKPFNHRSGLAAAVRVAFLLMEVFSLPLLCLTLRPVSLLYIESFTLLLNLTLYSNCTLQK